jgi:hypothetical protein
MRRISVEDSSKVWQLSIQRLALGLEINVTTWGRHSKLSSFCSFILGKILASMKVVLLPTPGSIMSESTTRISASHSRFNPVREYNKDKPQKFRVDLFVSHNNSLENI